MGLNIAEEKIRELEDIALEGIQNETHREKLNILSRGVKAIKETQIKLLTAVSEARNTPDGIKHCRKKDT